MKYQFVGLLLFLSGSLAAQPTTELMYDYANSGVGEMRTVTLLVKGNEMLSLMSASDTAKRPGDDFNIVPRDQVGSQVYRNAGSGELIFRDFVSRNGEFEPCLVRDSLSYTWTFGSERRRIGPYNCQQALTEFRGRKYEAWYSEDLPVPFGPWKFSGLPGGIIEIRSLDEVISFRLLKVSQSTKPIVRPGQAKEISMKEYAERCEGSVQDFIKKLTSVLPRGAQVEVSSYHNYKLEASFADVKR